MALSIAVDLLGQDLTGGMFSGLLGRVSTLAYEVERLGNTSQEGAGQLFALGGAAAGAGLAFSLFRAGVDEAFAAGGDLQMGLTRLQIASGDTGTAFNDLSQAVVDMATHSLYSTNDAAMAFSRMVEKGFSVQQVMYGMDPAAQKAGAAMYNAQLAAQGLGRQAMAVGEAMQTTATQGADLLAQAMLDFQDQGYSAADVANLLVGAFMSGIPSASELEQGIAMVGGAADTMGVKLDDMLTLLDMLAPRMGSASSAGASLNYMLQRMAAPTAANLAEMEELGLVTAKTGPSFDRLADSLAKSTGAGAAAKKEWSNGVAGLEAMFAAAKAAGQVPVGETFLEWATRSDLLNNKLFDAQGHFIGLKGAVEQIDTAMDNLHLTEQEKEQVIASLFNVRSGRAAQLLANLKQFEGEYNHTWEQVHAQNALKDAQKVMDTWQGSLHVLQTSLSSALGMIAQDWFAFLTPIVQGINNLVQWFNKLPAPVRQAVGVFLLVGTVLGGLATTVLGTAAAVGVLAAILDVSVGAVLAPVALAFGAVVAVAALAAGAFLLVRSGVINLTGPLHVLKAIWDAVVSVIGNLVAGFHQAWAAVQPFIAAIIGSLVPWLQRMWDSIGRVGGTALRFLGDALGHLGPAVQMLAQGFGAVLGPTLQAVGAIVGTLVGIIGSVLVPIIYALLQAGIVLWNGFVAAFSGILTVVSGVLTVVFNVIGAILQTIGALVSGNMDAIGRIWSQAWDGIKNGALDILRGLGMAIVGFFGGLLGTVIGGLVAFVQGVIQWFVHLFDTLVGHSVVPDMILAIAQWFLSLPGRILGALAGFAASVVGNFLGMAGSVIGTVAGFIGTLIGNFLGMEARGLGIIVSFIVGIVGKFLSLPGQVLGIIGGLVGDLLGKLGQMKDQAISAVQNLVSGAVNALSALPGQFASIAGNAIGALVGGIKAGVGAVAHAAGDLVGGLISGAKGLLGIQSPSRVFLDIGGYTVAGFVQGILGGHRDVQDAIGRTFSPQALGVTTPAFGAQAGAVAAAAYGAGAVTERGSIPLVVDGKKLAEVFYEVSGGHLRMNGMARQWR